MLLREVKMLTRSSEPPELPQADSREHMRLRDVTRPRWTFGECPYRGYEPLKGRFGRRVHEFHL